MEHIAQGNLTTEHINQDVNATAEQLKRQAAKHLNQTLNITPGQLQQRATEELKNQVGQCSSLVLRPSLPLQAS